MGLAWIGWPFVAWMLTAFLGPVAAFFALLVAATRGPLPALLGLGVAAMTCSAFGIAIYWSSDLHRESLEAVTLLIAVSHGPGIAAIAAFIWWWLPTGRDS